MNDVRRIKNRLIARLMSISPALSKHMLRSFEPLIIKEPPPWHPPSVAPSRARVAIVTTTGVHHKEQPPFNMDCQEGDPSFREIVSSCSVDELIITHDYYDHRDADKDINIVFPIERLCELGEEGLIGSISERHYSFMGHISDEAVNVLIKESSVEVAQKLKSLGVDIVLLTPG
jgi:D-proline reductase (dithiol) PrdB